MGHPGVIIITHRKLHLNIITTTVSTKLWYTIILICRIISNIMSQVSGIIKEFFVPVFLCLFLMLHLLLLSTATDKLFTKSRNLSLQTCHLLKSTWTWIESWVCHTQWCSQHTVSLNATNSNWNLLTIKLLQVKRIIFQTCFRLIESFQVDVFKYSCW